MAVRIDATTDFIRRNANIPSNTAFTYMVDAIILSDLGAPYPQALITSNIVTYQEGYGILWEGGVTDGSMVLLYTDGGANTQVLFASRPALLTPFCVYIRCSGTSAGQFTGGWRYPGGPWVTASGTLPATVTTPTRMEVGSIATTYNSDGMYQNFKVWNRALSDAELTTESDSAEVVHKQDLNLYAPMPHHNDLFDRGPYARNLTPGGTLTTGYFNYPRPKRIRRPAAAEAPVSTTFQILAGRKFSLAGMAGLAGD